MGAENAKDFQAQVIITNHPGKIMQGYTPVIDCHTSHIACKFVKLISKKKGNKVTEEPTFAKTGENLEPSSCPRSSCASSPSRSSPRSAASPCATCARPSPSVSSNPSPRVREPVSTTPERRRREASKLLSRLSALPATSVCLRVHVLTTVFTACGRYSWRNGRSSVLH